ncbi:ABC transporter permease [bacterium 0.1xD8-71]|nr:ABC transporter permease [bacterium 0.1xD8-71]
MNTPVVKEKGSMFKKVLGNQISVVFFILIALIIFFSVGAKGFFSAYNLKSLLQQTAVIGIITVAQTFVIITSGIDLSQGAIIGLTTLIASGMMVDLGLPIGVAVLAALLAAVLVGVVNGFFVAHVGLPAFITTLGTQYIIRSIALLAKGGNDIYNLPPEISNFGRGTIGGVFPNLAIIMIVIVVIMHLILKKFSFGRYVYACGSNVTAARFSGVKTKKAIFLVYVLAGFLCGIAGIVMMCRINAGIAVCGDGYEMNSICAVVIGGGSLFGGEGSISGALIGAFIMSVLSTGLQIMGFSTYWQQLITGIVLILAVMVDTIRRRRSQGME